MGEGENKTSGEIKNSIGSSIQQEDKQNGWVRKGRAMLPQNSSVWVKRKGMIKEPPELSCAGRDGRIFGRIPKVQPTHAKVQEEDTDSVTTEKYATQEQKLGGQEKQTGADHFAHKMK